MRSSTVVDAGGVLFGVRCEARAGRGSRVLALVCLCAAHGEPDQHCCLLLFRGPNVRLVLLESLVFLTLTVLTLQHCFLSNVSLL